MSLLIFLRHGQSQWNLEKRFTGWVNVPLSENGKEEAREAGKKIADLAIDKVYTTPLQRANRTFSLAWESSGKTAHPLFRYLDGRMKDWSHYTPLPDDNVVEVFVTEDFNERYYGDLQGLNKDDARAKWGEEQVHQWRRGFAVNPPNGESLKDTLERVLPTFQATVEKDLREGKNVLVVAHGNSLRAMTKYIENLSEDQIPGYEIKTGIPIVYELDADLNVVNKEILDA